MADPIFEVEQEFEIVSPGESDGLKFQSLTIDGEVIPDTEVKARLKTEVTRSGTYTLELEVRDEDGDTIAETSDEYPDVGEGMTLRSGKNFVVPDGDSVTLVGRAFN